MKREDFLNPDTIQHANKMLQRHKLSFEPKDIKYIIVDKENEIEGMVDKLMMIKDKYKLSERKVLGTRIISIKHISEDF